MIVQVASLAGRTALITGTRRGLGLAIARLFVAEGARVLCHARTDAQAQGVAEALGGEPVGGDLSTHAGVVQAARQTNALAPQLHILVHNAGAGSPGGLQDASREQWDRVMAVNAAAPLFLTQALLRPLRAAAPKARIVIISSDSGRFSVAKNGSAFPYRMSKAAVNMLTLNLAAALAADAIVVNAMHPGWLQTDMGGPGAPVPVAQAATAAHHLASLPDPAPTGRLWQENAPIGW